MCINYGRPILYAGEEIIRLGRLFLQHPLTNIADSRCVALYETFAIREPLLPLSRRVHGSNLDRLITEVADKLDEWEAYWVTYYGKYGTLVHLADSELAGLGLSSEDFLVTERLYSVFPHR